MCTHMVTSLTISTKAKPFRVLISDISINNYVQKKGKKAKWTTRADT